MADTTIVELTETTSQTENAVLPIDSGTQTFKMRLKNIAQNLHTFAKETLVFIASGSDEAEPGKVMVPNDGSNPVTVTLPATVEAGTIFRIIGKGAAGWVVNIQSGQTLTHDGRIQTDNNSILKSKQYTDCVEIVCLTANTLFAVRSFTGTPIIEGNYWGDGSDGDATISSDTSLTSTTDSDVIVKNYQNLTINATRTLTVANRCRGLWIYCSGDCEINGTLTMTNRGASADPTGTPSGGLRFARVKTGSTDSLSASDLGTDVGTALLAAEANQPAIAGNGKIYTIVKVGGAGAAAGGAVGGTIANGTGGGASGFSASGAGGAGTCFSGGAGGGGATGSSAGSNTGGAGGYGGASNGGGGAGNPGGVGGGTGSSGSSGTGGLLVLIVKGNLTIGSGALISANGANGGAGGGGSGGSSGGGRVIVLYAGTLLNSGTIQANGGGGTYAGGAGATTLEQISS